MQRGNARNRPAFTLIELLAVIAIIGLLMGIIVPGIQGARIQAKKSRSVTTLAAVEKALENFRAETGAYPVSNGNNPFENGSVFLSGAQWLGLSLLGADLRGYVQPDERNDTNADGKIDYKDWREWYSLTPKRSYTRSGPYLDTGESTAQTPETWARKNTTAGALPTSLTEGSSDYPNARIPFIVDGFGYPVLYYAANAAERTNCVWTRAGGLVPGRYDQTDNSPFTGGDGDGRHDKTETGLDLKGAGTAHPAGKLGFNGPTDPCDPDSFTKMICDENVFNTTKQGNKGRVWPHNADRFLLISPGYDGLWGTPDDVRNYQKVAGG